MALPERLEQIMDFLARIDAMKSVYRAAWLSDQSRNESDAEHTWHLMMFAILLHAETDHPSDLLKVLKMLAVHDVVEVIAGDTYLYDDERSETKQEREEQAAQELFRMLPEDRGTELEMLWREFEDGVTAEAVFCRALDRMQAVAQNVFAGGRTWLDNKITGSQVEAKNLAARDSVPELSIIFDALFGKAREGELWLSDEDPR